MGSQHRAGHPDEGGGRAKVLPADDDIAAKIRAAKGAQRQGTAEAAGGETDDESMEITQL